MAKQSLKCRTCVVRSSSNLSILTGVPSSIAFETLVNICEDKKVVFDFLNVSPLVGFHRLMAIGPLFPSMLSIATTVCVAGLIYTNAFFFGSAESRFTIHSVVIVATSSGFIFKPPSILAKEAYHNFGLCQEKTRLSGGILLNHTRKPRKYTDCNIMLGLYKISLTLFGWLYIV